MNPGEVIKPAVTKEMAIDLALKLYGFTVTSISEMVSFDDKNFHIKISTDHNNSYLKDVSAGGYTLKITNTAKSSLKGHFDSMHAAMKHLNKKGLSAPLPVRNLNGQTWSLQDVPLLRRSVRANKSDQPNTGKCGVHLLTYLPGVPVGSKEYTISTLHQWGNLLAQFHIAIQDFTNDVMYRKEIFWNIEHILEIKQFMKGLPEDKASLVLSVLDQYEEKVAKVLPNLPSGFIHGDFNENNVLIRQIETTSKWKVDGILDFEDMHRGTYAWDVGMMLAYVSLECKKIDPIEGMGHCLAGYLQRRSLSDAEIDVLKMCIVCRLCQSLVLGAYCHSIEPANDYLLVSAKFGWARLKFIWEKDQTAILDSWRKVIDSYSITC